MILQLNRNSKVIIFELLNSYLDKQTLLYNSKFDLRGQELLEFNTRSVQNDNLIIDFFLLQLVLQVRSQMLTTTVVLVSLLICSSNYILLFYLCCSDSTICKCKKSPLPFSADYLFENLYYKQTTIVLKFRQINLI